MFPAETYNAQYMEEQAAKYAAKRLAQDQAQAALAAARSSAVSTPNGTRPNTPANTQPRTGLLGNFFQGFVRVTAYDYGDAGSKSASSTPGSEKSELEALIAEKKRDADICAMPQW